MDCQMPEMDGFEASSEIRRSEQAQDRNRTPIIAMTANAMHGDREKCVAAGMDDYLVKPMKPEDLEETLKKWLPPTGVASRSASAPIDLDRLTATFGEDRKIIDELLAIYLDTTPPLLERLKHLVERQDDAAARAAHEIKGASGYIVAPEMAALAREIEAAVKAAQWEAASSLAERMEAAFIRVLAFAHARLTANR
jgi:CheY-like chemotaxis protein